MFGPKKLGPAPLKWWVLVVFALFALTCGKTDRSTAEPSTLGCIPPALACNGRCVDIASDPASCGACGAACPAGDRCVDGVCRSTGCPAGRTDCGGMCVDLVTNPLNCGACNKACASAEACIGGKCACSAGQACGSECVDFASSSAHCGSCGHACAPEEECRGGNCRARCEIPLSPCGEHCRDLWSDATSCGGCDTKCAPGEQCVEARCQCPNDTNHALCGGVCMDVTTDIKNCGACGNACPAGNHCVRGFCAQCAADLFFCPSGTGDQRDVCLSQAKSAKASADAGTRGDSATPPLSPDFECQCNQCLTELKDCASDYYCALAWQCAVKRGCTAGCWGPMAMCQIGSDPGCFKWCPPLTDATQTAARVEALLRCTREKGCGI